MNREQIERTLRRGNGTPKPKSKYKNYRADLNAANEKIDKVATNLAFYDSDRRDTNEQIKKLNWYTIPDMKKEYTKLVDALSKTVEGQANKIKNQEDRIETLEDLLMKFSRIADGKYIPEPSKADPDKVEALHKAVKDLAAELSLHIKNGNRAPCNDCGELTNKDSGVQRKGEPIIPLCQQCLSVHFAPKDKEHKADRKNFVDMSTIETAAKEFYGGNGR